MTIVKWVKHYVHLMKKLKFYIGLYLVLVTEVNWIEGNSEFRKRSDSSKNSLLMMQKISSTYLFQNLNHALFFVWMIEQH